MKCRGLHEVLLVEELNALGAVVLCLQCGDTFQIREDTLANRYYHTHHVSPEGPNDDFDTFIVDTMIERK